MSVLADGLTWDRLTARHISVTALVSEPVVGACGGGGACGAAVPPSMVVGYIEVGVSAGAAAETPPIFNCSIQIPVSVPSFFFVAFSARTSASRKPERTSTQ